MATMRKILDEGAECICKPVLDHLRTKFPSKKFFGKKIPTYTGYFDDYTIYQERFRGFFLPKKILDISCASRLSKTVKYESFCPDLINEKMAQDLMKDVDIANVSIGYTFAARAYANDY